MNTSAVTGLGLFVGAIAFAATSYFTPTDGQPIALPWNPVIECMSTNVVGWVLCPASNFHASVSWRTNVVYGDNHTGCELFQKPFGNGGIILTPAVFHAPHEGCAPYEPPTEKWIETNVLEVHTLSFDWFGRRTVEHVIPISSTTNRWRLEQTWTKQ